MSTSVYLRLKDGRLVKLKDAPDRSSAASLKEHLEQWRKDGVTLTVTDAHGLVEDITPRRVWALEEREGSGPAQQNEPLDH